MKHFEFRGEKVVLEKKRRHSTARDLVGIVPIKRRHSNEEIAGARRAAVLAKWGRK